MYKRSAAGAQGLGQCATCCSEQRVRVLQRPQSQVRASRVNPDPGRCQPHGGSRWLWPVQVGWLARDGLWPYLCRLVWVRCAATPSRARDRRAGTHCNCCPAPHAPHSCTLTPSRAALARARAPAPPPVRAQALPRHTPRTPQNRRPHGSNLCFRGGAAWAAASGSTSSARG